MYLSAMIMYLSAIRVKKKVYKRLYIKHIQGYVKRLRFNKILLRVSKREITFPYGRNFKEKKRNTKGYVNVSPIDMQYEDF